MQDLLEEPPSPKLDIMIVQYLGKIWKEEGSIRRRRLEGFGRGKKNLSCCIAVMTVLYITYYPPVQFSVM